MAGAHASLAMAAGGGRGRRGAVAEGERRGREREGLRGRESGEGGRGVKKGKKLRYVGPTVW